MSIWTGEPDAPTRNQEFVASGQSKCKRCGKWFQPKSPGQELGPKCARKWAGQHTLPDGTIEIWNENGERTAVIV